MTTHIFTLSQQVSNILKIFDQSSFDFYLNYFNIFKNQQDDHVILNFFVEDSTELRQFLTDHFFTFQENQYYDFNMEKIAHLIIDETEIQIQLVKSSVLKISIEKLVYETFREKEKEDHSFLTKKLLHRKKHAHDI